MIFQASVLKFCEGCGVVVVAEQKFCKVCGSELRELRKRERLSEERRVRLEFSYPRSFPS